MQLASTETQPPLPAESAPCNTALQHQLEQVEALTNELKRVLVHYEDTLQEEGIRGQIATLERWAESYRKGLSAANKISEHAPAWLGELKDKLKLAADELHRLEAEGGNPADSQQEAKADELMSAMRRIDNVLPAVEQMFTPAQQEERETEPAPAQ